MSEEQEICQQCGKKRSTDDDGYWYEGYCQQCRDEHFQGAWERLITQLASTPEGKQNIDILTRLIEEAELIPEEED